VLNAVAAAWGDSVVTLAVCTAALLGLVAAGHGGPLGALGWAAGMAAAWWVFAASILIIIRQGTPGMLLAGVVFAAPVPPRRLSLVLVAAMFHAMLLGLPSLLGASRAPLALAAGSALEAVPTE
jgi:hypothetical protein